MFEHTYARAHKRKNLAILGIWKYGSEKAITTPLRTTLAHPDAHANDTNK